jgi:hypothetical protein
MPGSQNPIVDAALFQGNIDRGADTSFLPEKEKYRRQQGPKTQQVRTRRMNAEARFVSVTGARGTEPDHPPGIALIVLIPIRLRERVSGDIPVRYHDRRSDDTT